MTQPETLYPSRSTFFFSVLNLFFFSLNAHLPIIHNSQSEPQLHLVINSSIFLYTENQKFKYGSTGKRQRKQDVQSSAVFCFNQGTQ